MEMQPQQHHEESELAGGDKELNELVTKECFLD